MGNAFITLWSRPQVEIERRMRSGQDMFVHTANAQFRSRSVAPGDSVYVVATRDGVLLLLGRLIVDRVVDQREAARVLPNEPYVAPDHLLGRGAPLDLNREVPEPIARALERESGKRIKIAADVYRVDVNSLRTTGRITADSAALLDTLLDDA
jgi:hypothetical protein